MRALHSPLRAPTHSHAPAAWLQALQLAQKVDPSNSRTIGVLTKIDLMDRGTNAMDILNNKKYPLKLGWVGVVNRSQSDIEGRKTLAQAKEAEKAYFHSTESPYKCARNEVCEYTVPNDLCERLCCSTRLLWDCDVGTARRASRRCKPYIGGCTCTPTAHQTDGHWCTFCTACLSGSTTLWRIHNVTSNVTWTVTQRDTNPLLAQGLQQRDDERA